MSECNPADRVLTDALSRVEVVTGDITTLAVEAIVNAANTSLLGGGGVDGAIHRAAGPRLREHNQSLGGCVTGLAKITPAFDLESHGVKKIIHAVGPVWSLPDEAEAEKLGNLREDVLLASCYMRSLDLARDSGCQTVAFPAISTGVYRFPRRRAARIAAGHVLGFLQQNATPGRVTFCCFSEDDASLYRETLATTRQWMFNRPRTPESSGPNDQ